MKRKKKKAPKAKRKTRRAKAKRKMSSRPKKKRRVKAKRKARRRSRPKARKTKKRRKAKAKKAAVETQEVKTKKRKGPKMAKRRKKHGKKKGIFGSQRGAAMLPPKGMVKHAGMKIANGLEGLATAKVLQFVLSKLPINRPSIKSGLQAGLGLLFSLYTDKKPWLRGVGDGPYYIGLAGLSNHAFGMEVMAGDEDLHLVVDESGAVREMSGAELEEARGFAGDIAPSMSGDFRMGGDGDADFSRDMEGDFQMG